MWFQYASDPLISDVTDESFKISVKIEDFGLTSEMVVMVEKDNGVWKASSFSINGGQENVR